MIDAAELAARSSLFSPCQRYRTWLKRGEGGDLVNRERRILWVLCNPSVAGALRDDGSEKSDKTISTCVGFGERMGANRHGFLNLLSAIGTDPASILGMDDPDGPLNAETWAAAFDWLKQAERPILMFAWGGKLWHDRQEGGRELLNARSRSIVRAFALADQHVLIPKALGLTANGSPRHPSRLGYDAIDQLVSLNAAWRKKNL